MGNMTQTKTKVDTSLQEPPMYKVIYINDDHTSMEFVIDSLMDYFDYSIVQAQKITEDVHVQGSAVVAVMPYEMAEQKGIEVTVAARSNGYPLQIKIEVER